jgi:predicted transcriptional regulator YdeE
MMVAGVATRTNKEDELEGAAKIPDLCGLFLADDLEEKLARLARGDGTVRAVYTDYESDLHGDYTYLLGYEVEDVAAIPEGVEIRQWPASKYAVFVSSRGPLFPTVAAAWRQIWAMEESGQLGGKRTYIGDFEVHENKTLNLPEVEIRIYIGIE